MNIYKIRYWVRHTDIDGWGFKKYDMAFITASSKVRAIKAFSLAKPDAKVLPKESIKLCEA